jgi:hypothetical protein
MRRWASQLFSQALPSVVDARSPRCLALALLGIHEYFRRFSGDRLANQIRESLTADLLRRFEAARADGWEWFEDVLSYGNATLPHALVLSGRWGRHGGALEMGLRSLRWLMEVQTADAGHFRPIGSEGFYPRGGRRALFDQQPIEAYASVSACLEAYFATEDEFWMKEARRAFDWFLGRNDLGQPVYDPVSGGCYDALHMDRVNLNQGAESTLSFLLALEEMRLVESALGAFEHPAGVRPPGAEPDGAATGPGPEATPDVRV